MTYLVAGLVIGAVYVIMGTSIALTYSATGVLNLATGAIAYVVADIYYDFVVVHHLSTIPAALICVVVIAPVLGLILWKFIFDRLEQANLIVQLVATIGLAVALPGLMDIITPHTVVLQAAGIVPHGQFLIDLGFTKISRDQLAAICGEVLVVVLIVFLIERTRAGLAMRGTVDRPLLAQTVGIDTRKVSAAAWVLSSMFIGLAGLLVAPLIQLNAPEYTSLTVAALSVALVGRFQHILPVVAAGIGLGVAASFMTGYAPQGNIWISGLTSSLPFVLLIVLILAGVRPTSARQDAATTTSLMRRVAHEGPASSGAAGSAGVPGLSRAAQLIELGVRYRLALRSKLAPGGVSPALVVVGLAAILFVLYGMSSYWLGIMTVGLAFSIIFLSFSVATGEGGVLCLGQAAFVAAGAFTAGRLATAAHFPLLLALVVGVVVAGAVGLVVGVIGMRLDQLGFALITLGFMLFCQEFIYTMTSIVPTSGIDFNPLSLFGLNLVSGRSQFLLNLVVFVLLGWGLMMVRRGRLGRRLAATRGNATSSQSLGIDVRALRLGTFVVSAAIAGLGGILLGICQSHIGTEDVQLFTGLVWLAVAVTSGVMGVRGALIGGLLYAAIPAIFVNFSSGVVGNLPSVVFGLGAVVLAEEPRGGIAKTGQQLQWLWSRLVGGALPAGPAPQPVAAEEPPPTVSRPSGVPVAAGTAMVRLSDVAVAFGGLRALDEVTVEIGAGEIVGLIGPNGAGKSTLLNVVSGFIHPARGSVLFDQADITSEGVHRRARLGLGRTYQRVTLFPELTVAEHRALAEDLARRRLGGAPVEAAELEPYELFGLGRWADATVESLPLGVARLVELAMVLSMRPKVVLLDEPMSGLSTVERRRLSDLLRALRGAYGLSMLMVEHDIDTAVRVVDRLIVLDFGRVIADGTPAEVMKNALVRSAYFGDAEVPAVLDRLAIAEAER